jgi:tetratricopeptide (TPR) repeat protein
MSNEVYFENIHTPILEKLNEAAHSIRVAVAWFTDQQLFERLVQKAAEGVTVIVIIRNDVINLGQSGLAWQELLNNDGSLYFSPDSPALHHKFCLIDDKTLISGSYNWTYGARRNRENALYTQQSEVVKAFRKEFNFLLDYAIEVTSMKEARALHPPATNTVLQQEVSVEVAIKEQEAQQQLVEDEYEALLQDAWDAYRQKLHQEAEAITKRAIKLYPKEPEAHRILADIYWRTNQNQKAVEAAKRIEEFGIQDTRLWNTYGLAYDGLKKHKAAIAYYDRCIKMEPEITTWYHNKCFALIAFGAEKAGDKVALLGMEIAIEEIKQARVNGNDYRLMRIHIELGALKTDSTMARSNAVLAQEIYNSIPLDEQDLHDLEDIEGLLKRK